MSKNFGYSVLGSSVAFLLPAIPRGLTQGFSIDQVHQRHVCCCSCKPLVCLFSLSTVLLIQPCIGGCHQAPLFESTVEFACYCPVVMVFSFKQSLFSLSLSCCDNIWVYRSCVYSVNLITELWRNACPHSTSLRPCLSLLEGTRFNFIWSWCECSLGPFNYILDTSNMVCLCLRLNVLQLSSFFINTSYKYELTGLAACLPRHRSIDFFLNLFTSTIMKLLRAI